MKTRNAQVYDYVRAHSREEKCEGVYCIMRSYFKKEKQGACTALPHSRGEEMEMDRGLSWGMSCHLLINEKDDKKQVTGRYIYVRSY